MEEKPDETGASSDISPRKTLTRFAAQSGIVSGSAHTTMRLLKLQHGNPNSGTRIYFCNWFLGISG
jgi:hypothetical protein